MTPGVGFGDRGERAGTGEFDEGEVERESWWRDCSSSPSESLNLFVETLLLGVAWAFGDDIVDEGSCCLATHVTQLCKTKVGRAPWKADSPVYDTTEKRVLSEVRNELNLRSSFGNLSLMS